ncbi:hypothetical protein LRAMOSA01487 [Lichtheimia ramosa]|uniref:Chitosanase n=1 Tax=Lichtheimia ramosa TaxID=688394 RepID=A0A077WKA7_9FUNG|nr:hypothetical protein LRAMOSA01487 [Lichtheimia ramosa]
MYIIILNFLILASSTCFALPKKRAFDGCVEAPFAPTPDTCAKFEFQDQPRGVCVELDSGSTPFVDLDGFPDIGSVDAKVTHVASMVTNVFEYGTKAFSYAACANIGDMRGFTCGYIGFTTGTNDASQVVKTYTKEKPGNELAGFISRLSDLDTLDTCNLGQRASTSGLEQFCDAWRREACLDDHFAQIQSNWAYEHYVVPSARIAASAGVYSPLGQLVFYDAIIQHGYQFTESHINVLRLLELTGPRQQDESEQQYLTRFLTTRRQMQCCYPDGVWPASATRTIDLQSLVDQFDLLQNLDKPLVLNRFGQVVDPNEPAIANTNSCSGVSA